MPLNDQIVIYQTTDRLTQIDVRMENETVWLSANQMAELFDRDEKTIRKHINNVFTDVIISVGNRVKSQRGTQFRIWANEGYLVALKIDEDSDFRNEIQRLSNSFGIGIIKLNVENIDESEIVCTARHNEIIDWDTLDRLAEDSPDFCDFISDLKEDIALQKVKSKYDDVLTDDAYDDYVRVKKIVNL